MRWINVVLAGLALTSGVPALAASWIYVATSSSDTVLYYDADSIQRSGNQVTVWEKLDFSRNKKERARMSLALTRYDCANRTYTARSVIQYFPDGTTNSVTLQSHQLTADPIPPDTMAEFALKALCATN